MVRDVRGQMIIRISRARHPVPVLKENRLELTRVPGIESVEVIESKTTRPVIERADFARLPRRRVVILSDPGGGVTILLEDLGNRSRALRNDCGVAIVTGGELRDDAGSRHMMVATGEQRRARR